MKSANKRDIDKLVDGLKRQDKKSQEVLYKKYFGLMMSIGMHYCENWDDAKEVVNTAFLKVFTKIEYYTGVGSFEGWMKKTIVNTSLDYIKSKKFDKVDIDDINYLNEELFVENEAASNINSEDIMKMIQELPNASKIVFNMYIIEGYKHKEISELLNISEGTSHWHLQNARKLLMNKINNLL